MGAGYRQIFGIGLQALANGLATFLAGPAAEKVKISERMMVGDIWGRVIGRSLGSACRLSQIV
jgi:hypothetical protein